MIESPRKVLPLAIHGEAPQRCGPCRSEPERLFQPSESVRVHWRRVAGHPFHHPVSQSAAPGQHERYSLPHEGPDLRKREPLGLGTLPATAGRSRERAEATELATGAIGSPLCRLLATPRPPSTTSRPGRIVTKLSTLPGRGTTTGCSPRVWLARPCSTRLHFGWPFWSSRNSPSDFGMENYRRL